MQRASVFIIILVFLITGKNLLANDRSSSSLNAVEGNQCSAVVNQSTKRSWPEKRALGYETQYAFRRTYEKRVSPIVNGSYEVLFHTQYPELEGDLGQTTIVMGWQTRQVSTEINSLEAPGIEVSNKLFTQIANKAGEFGIETYQRRRPHWKGKFLKKLRAIRRRWLRQSTYISTQDGVGYDPDAQTHATLRLIKEKDGIVPMEEYLGIRVDVGGKLKVEPGNFAIDRAYNESLRPEIFIHLLNRSNTRLVEGRENHYLTYADKYSLAMYTQLGFTPIDPVRMKITDPETKIENGKILKDDIWWTPMEANQETLDQLLPRHVEGLRKRGHDEEEVQTVLDRQNEVDHNPMGGLEIRNIRGKGVDTGRKVDAELEISRGQNQVQIVLRLDNEYQGIPIANFPETLMVFDGHSHTLGNQTFIYQNGVLTVEKISAATKSGDATLKFELRTTPEFRLILGLRMTGSIGEKALNIGASF
jgi:hypothetical protein